MVHRVFGVGNSNVVIWAKTYEGFQGAEELRDALEASWAKQFVFSKTSTDGEVPQPQQLDVWMVGVVTLKSKSKAKLVSLLGSNSLVSREPMGECYGEIG